MKYKYICKECGKISFAPSMTRIVKMEKLCKDCFSEKKIREKKTIREVCKWCGTEFFRSKAERTKYCSDECRRKGRIASNKLGRQMRDYEETRVCEWCGKEFKRSVFSLARYCSKKCSGKGRAIKLMKRHGTYTKEREDEKRKDD